MPQRIRPQKRISHPTGSVFAESFTSKSGKLSYSSAIVDSLFFPLKGPDVGYQRPYLVLLDRVREGGHTALCRPAVLDHAGLRAVIDELEIVVVGHVAALIQENIVDQARADASLALLSVARGTVLLVKRSSLADGDRVPCERVREML